MNMFPLIISLVLFGLAALAGVALFFSFKKNVPAEIKPQSKSAPPAEDLKVVNFKQVEEIASLSEKLRNIKADYNKLELELCNTKKSESKAQEELKKANQWVEKQQASEGGVFKDNQLLKEQLVKKDQECEKEFSANLLLNKELKPLNEQLAALQKEKSLLEERIRVLEALNKSCNAELKKKDEELVILKKKNEETEWVSKKEYDKLKEQLEKKPNP